MSILQESYDFVQTRLLPKVSKRHRKLFTFGFEALTIRPFVSLNANARITIPVRNTAQSKMLRLVSNVQILQYFSSFVSDLQLVKPTDSVNVDFSTFCGFNVLTFAKQTHLGRALPLFFALIVYPIDEGSQTRFIMKEITRFSTLLGFCPHLVFDRGFESPYIIPFFVKENISFTLRLKKDKHVMYQIKDIPLRNLPWHEKDCLVSIYQAYGCTQPLRVVVSEKLSERIDGNGNTEPWYLLTNDFVSSRERIVGRYYFRFEIEETFKDVKHIFNLKKFYTIEKQQTFYILLWFVMLGVWLSFLLEETKQYLTKRVQQKRRKRLSITRFFTESIQIELFTSFKKQFL